MGRREGQKSSAGDSSAGGPQARPAGGSRVTVRAGRLERRLCRATDGPSPDGAAPGSLSKGKNEVRVFSKLNPQRYSASHCSIFLKAEEQPGCLMVTLSQLLDKHCVAGKDATRW